MRESELLVLLMGVTYGVFKGKFVVEFLRKVWAGGGAFYSEMLEAYRKFKLV